MAPETTVRGWVSSRDCGRQCVSGVPFAELREDLTMAESNIGRIHYEPSDQAVMAAAFSLGKEVPDEEVKGYMGWGRGFVRNGSLGFR